MKPKENLLHFQDVRTIHTLITKTRRNKRKQQHKISRRRCVEHKNQWRNINSVFAKHIPKHNQTFNIHNNTEDKTYNMSDKSAHIHFKQPHVQREMIFCVYKTGND